MVIPSANVILRTTFPSCPLERYLGLINALTLRQSSSFCANPPARKKTKIASPKTAFLTDSPNVFLPNRMVLPHHPRVKVLYPEIQAIVRLYFSLAIEYIIDAESK